MKTFYIIENFNKLANLWVQYDFIQYKTLQMAKNEVERFKENKTKDKLRVVEVKIVYEKK
jgi:allophanate hydrolase subunit 1